MSNIKYQPEVDGLRAVAILSVIIFHARESWLPGGFIGVDMFFVISGYLIAMILMNNNAMPSRVFLTKRVKRILPAYLVLLIGVLLVGVLIMSTEDLYQLSKEAAAALFQVTNIVSLNKAPYFSGSSLELPLLHTWSLAVEWQFYLLVAALLYILHKGLKAKYIAIIIAVLGVLSFLLSVYFSLNDDLTSHAYYNFASRFWEFCIGIATAMLCHANISRLAGSASYIGITVFFASLFIINDTLAFPGFWALLPVLGTAAVIYGSQKETLVKALMSSRPLVFCGALSYSLYLWHWPVFAFVRYVNSSEVLSLTSIFICLSVTITLSFVSYYLIEKSSKGEAVLNKIKLVFIGIFIVCLALVLARGGSRFNELAHETTKSKIQCVTGGTLGCGDMGSSTKVLLIGDSHAWHYGAALEQVSKLEGWHLTIAGMGACAPVITQNSSYMLLTGRRKEPCDQHRNYLQEAMNKYDKIFMAARWDSIFENESFEDVLSSTLATLSQGKAEINVLAEAPLFIENNTRKAFLNKRYGVGLILSNEVSPLYLDANKTVQGVVERHTKIKFIDVSGRFCVNGECSPFIGGEFAYIDNNHLNIAASRKLAESIQQQVSLTR